MLKVYYYIHGRQGNLHVGKMQKTGQQDHLSFARLPIFLLSLP
jgi:hypothetical protein